MLKEKILPVSILCLSISLIISASIIANGIKNSGIYVSGGLSNIHQGLNNFAGIVNNFNNNSVNSLVNRRSTYDLAAAAEYLGVTQGRLREIVDIKDSRIPYIKIGDGYIFNKGALDKWLETARLEIK